jgi:hypothetical protein
VQSCQQKYHRVSEKPSLPAEGTQAGTLLFVLTMALFVLFLGGYQAFRGDHLTQVPMLLKMENPQIYPNDWFFNGKAHYSTRYVFLHFEVFLLGIFQKVELVLFAQYCVYLVALVWALWALCRHTGKNGVFLIVWVFLIAVLDEFANLGATRLVEKLTIPRIYPYVGIYWAIPLLMAGHSLAAGLILGALGLFQGAPSLQFLIVSVAWLLALRGLRQRGKHLFLLAASFALTYFPQVFLSSPILQAQHYSGNDIVHFVAYVRHPHHMLPLQFAAEHYVGFLGLLMLFWGVVAANGGMRYGGDARIITLIGVLMMYFLASAFLIHVVPVYFWIVFQPFRLFSVFRGLMFFFVAMHVQRLLLSESRTAKFRGFLLLFAAYNFENHGLIFTVLMFLESFFVWIESRVVTKGFEKITFWGTLVGLGMWFPEGRSRFFGLLALYLAFVYRAEILAILRRVWAFVSERRRLLVMAASADVIFLAMLLFFPFTKWDRSPTEWGAIDRFHYRFATKYQVYPFRDGALEQAGVWAERNTPPDGLFLIPPGRKNCSFHIWSRRSAVFSVKTFPYEKSEWAEWIERYLAVRGILDTGHRREDMQIVLDDAGAKRADLDYAGLDERTLIAVARRYGADYIVSNAEFLLDSERLRKVAGPFNDLSSVLKSHSHKRPYYVYTIVSSERLRAPN